ncbi:AaceriACL048Wp [[Ashbya] aceris (nom. inval.)]|nr:AaceriACL048Wp [[Ashbya] aceris (nom. inval.)]
MSRRPSYNVEMRHRMSLEEPKPPKQNYRRVMEWLHKVWEGPTHPSDEVPARYKGSSFVQVVDSVPRQLWRGVNKTGVKATVLVLYCCLWVAVGLGILYPSLVALPYHKGDEGKAPVLAMSCSSRLHWLGKNNVCDLNARRCRRSENKEYIVRCPALCDHNGLLFSAVPVGDKLLKYTMLTIGGGARADDTEAVSYPYRGDSAVCSSAMHAGLISPAYGGCVRVATRGQKNKYPSRRGRTGWSSNFDSFFPSSFEFLRLDGYQSGCRDPRVPFTVCNMIFSLPVLYFYNMLVGFWILMLAGYWTLVLAMDPPVFIDPNNRLSIYTLWSIGCERLLPLCFVLYAMWRVAVRKLEGGPPLLRLLLFYPLFWVGTLNNITFDRLPVDRLTPKDLQERAGTAAAVFILAFLLIVCAAVQAHAVWKSGRLRKFLALYLGLAMALVFLGLLPGLNLRIHHYIMGLLLLPGCATRGPSAYLFQGVLLGLVISGVGRWGFASIVETNLALARGEAGFTDKPPTLKFDPVSPHAVSWTPRAEVGFNSSRYDAFSLLVNDIEVYVGTNTTVDLDVLSEENKEFGSMLRNATENTEVGPPLYIRVASRSQYDLDLRSDYTGAGVLDWSSGSWSPPNESVVT